MADTNTTNLNLIKPEIGGAEDTWGVSINSDLDALDAIFSATGTEIDVRFNSANFDDNKKAIFGTGDDLQIYHDGSNSFIQDAGTGTLRILSDDVRIMNAAGTEISAQFIQDGEARLKFDNSTKLATKTGGIEVTGNINNTSGDLTLDVAGDITLDADGANIKFANGGVEFGQILTNATPNDFVIRSSISDEDMVFQGNDDGTVFAALTLDMSAAGKATFNDAIVASGISQFSDVNIPDNNAIRFGNSQDLQIYHDGTHSYVANGTNTLYLRTASTLQIENADGSEDLATFGVNGAATLFHDNSYKLATTSSGINIDGGIDIKDGSSLNGTITSSSNSLTLNARNTGVLLFQSGGNEKARIDGSGNLLVGTTGSSLSNSSSATGINLIPNGASTLVRDGGTALYLNRLSSEGTIVDFRKDGSTLGSIQVAAGTIKINGPDGSGLYFGNSSIFNSGDATKSLGISTNRFTDLHLSGAAYTGGILKGSASSSTKTILNAKATQTELHTAGNDGLIFKGSGDNELARIDSSGRLGIGTSSPATPLEVRTSSDTEIAAIRTGSVSAKLGAFASGESRLTSAGNDGFLTFYTGTSSGERVRIDSSGNLLVGGTTSPDTNGITIETTASSGGLNILSPTTGRGDIFFGDSGDKNIGQIRYAHSDNSMTFRTNASDRVAIDSSGNLLVGKTAIGVGTTGSEIRADGQISIVREFATPLYINRKSDDGDVVDLRKDNTTFGTVGISSNDLIIKSVLDDKDIIFKGNDGGSSFTALTLDMSNAGLAIFNDGVKADYFKATSSIPSETSANTAYLDFASGNARIVTKGADGSTQGGFQILQQASDSSPANTPFAIDASGNIGISTTSPADYYADQLVVSAPSEGGITLASTATSNVNYLLFADGTSGDAAYRGQLAYNHSNDLMSIVSSGTMDFRTGSSRTERMRIDSSGNIGIGTSSPDRQLSINDFSGNGTLSINASTSGASTVYFADGSSGTSIYAGYIQYSHADNSMQFATNGGSERMRITSAGGVGINTTSVTGPLTVQELSNQVIRSESTGSGTVTHLQFVKTSGGAAQIGSITGTTSSVSYNTTSDYRLKENVITDWNATTLLKQLKPSKFNFKDNQSETITGFIAHEIQEILPYLVSGEKDGEDMQSMDYAKLTPLLTKAIQEQQAIIEDLQTQINNLRGK